MIDINKITPRELIKGTRNGSLFWSTEQVQRNVTQYSEIETKSFTLIWKYNSNPIEVLQEKTITGKWDAVGNKLYQTKKILYRIQVGENSYTDQDTGEKLFTVVQSKVEEQKQKAIKKNFIALNSLMGGVEEVVVFGLNPTESKVLLQKAKRIVRDKESFLKWLGKDLEKVNRINMGHYPFNLSWSGNPLGEFLSDKMGGGFKVSTFVLTSHRGETSYFEIRKTGGEYSPYLLCSKSNWVFEFFYHLAMKKAMRLKEPENGVILELTNSEIINIILGGR